MGFAARVRVKSHHLAGIIDLEYFGVDSSGEVDRAETAPGKQKAMNFACTIRVASYDLAIVVDPPAAGLNRPRIINRVEAAPGKQKAMI